MLKKDRNKEVSDLNTEDFQRNGQPLLNQPIDRRSFLKNSSLSLITSLLGTKMVFAEHFPPNLTPIATD